MTSDREKLHLQDIKDWNTPSLCVPRAFAAVSGMTPTEAAVVIANRARLMGATIATDLPNQSFAPEHWFNAIGDIGGNPSIKNMVEPYPSFATYVKSPATKQLHFVVGVHPDGADTHVFAYENNVVVDEYTGGKVTDVSTITITGRFSEYLVKYIILLD